MLNINTSQNLIEMYINQNIEIKINQESKILYINVINGNYIKENFIEGVEYYKNFWILVNNTDDKYYQMFIFNDVKFYPLEFYDTIFKTFKGLEDIFKKNLYCSCLVNDSNAMDIFRPLLNMYKAVRPFSFVKTVEEGYKFLENSKNTNIDPINKSINQ